MLSITDTIHARNLFIWLKNCNNQLINGRLSEAVWRGRGRHHDWHFNDVRVVGVVERPEVQGKRSEDPAAQRAQGTLSTR